MKLVTILLSILQIVSCKSHNYDIDELFAKEGCNKAEIQKAIVHFQQEGNQIKIQALNFLLKNIDNKYGRYGQIVVAYYPVFKILDSVNKIKLAEDTIKNIISREWKNIEFRNGFITEQNYQYLMDYQVINSDFLIENIDYAFAAWQKKPWAKQYDFETFCEYILPYRLFDEPLQFNRKKIFSTFAWVEDSLKDKSNPLEVCQLVSDYVAKHFNFCSQLSGFPMVGVSDQLALMGGVCEHRYLLVGSILRSLGIPVCVDYTPQFNSSPNGHSWLVTFDKMGNYVPFNAGEPNIKVECTQRFPIEGVYGATKVYRRFFSKQYDQMDNNLLVRFRDQYIKDVSNLYYYPQQCVTFRLDKKSDLPYFYLCSFGMGTALTVVDYGENKTDSITFSQVGSKCCYFLADIDGLGRLTVLSNPKYLFEGNIYELSPDTIHTINMRLTRKFLPSQYNFKMLDYALWLKGAKFQAANNISFSKPYTLFEIDREDYLSFVEKDVFSQTPYRFYRFLASDTGKIRIAELGFIIDSSYSIPNETRISGYYLHQTSEQIPIFENAFDRNIATNLNAPAKSYVIVDYGKKVKLKKIQFLIRNDLNAVDIGDTYELFYFDFGWKSLGKCTASSNYVEFRNIPTNAVFLLKDLTKGKEERVFMIKNGEQVWL